MPKTIRNQFDKYLTYEKLLEAHKKARRIYNVVIYAIKKWNI